MSTKQEIYHMIEAKAFDRLLDFFDRRPNMVRKYVTMATHHENETFRRQAIDFLGFLAEKRADARPEYFREIIRRHLWGMNEESGNMDWSAPEIIGAIIAARPNLFGEFSSVMIEAALHEPVFYQGLLQAVRMMALQDKKLIAYHLPRLKEFAEQGDHPLADQAKQVLQEIGVF